MNSRLTSKSLTSAPASEVPTTPINILDSNLDAARQILAEYKNSLEGAKRQNKVLRNKLGAPDQHPIEPSVYYNPNHNEFSNSTAKGYYADMDSISNQGNNLQEKLNLLGTNIN